MSVKKERKDSLKIVTFENCRMFLRLPLALL